MADSASGSGDAGRIGSWDTVHARLAALAGDVDRFQALLGALAEERRRLADAERRGMQAADDLERKIAEADTALQQADAVRLSLEAARREAHSRAAEAASAVADARQQAQGVEATVRDTVARAEREVRAGIAHGHKDIQGRFAELSHELRTLLDKHQRTIRGLRADLSTFEATVASHEGRLAQIEAQLKEKKGGWFGRVAG